MNAASRRRSAGESMIQASPPGPAHTSPSGPQGPSSNGLWSAGATRPIPPVVARSTSRNARLYSGLGEWWVDSTWTRGGDSSTLTLVLLVRKDKHDRGRAE